ncbi:hypothetical protein GTY51_25130 [Streptomyces sp. SID4936]|nr:hypothetical protein [Streptomyces sp. SID4936]
MPDASTVLWSHDTCRALRKAGRVGERPPVAFHGVHSSLSAWTGARAGDEAATPWRCTWTRRPYAGAARSLAVGKRFSGTPNLPGALRIFRCVGAR